MVFEKIAAIISEKLELEPGLVKLESSFSDMQVDSLYMVEIMLTIEDEFNITIEETDNLSTVQDLVNYVESRL